MKGRDGIVAGYNAKGVVSPPDPATANRSILLITAADVDISPDDYGQLAPMLEQAEEMTGERTEVILAAGGYHSGPNLRACERRGQQIVMPEGQMEALKGPYFIDRFKYDGATDSFICPHGQRLIFRGLSRHNGDGGMRVNVPREPSAGHVRPLASARKTDGGDGLYGSGLIMPSYVAIGSGQPQKRHRSSMLDANRS